MGGGIQVTLLYVAGTMMCIILGVFMVKLNTFYKTDLFFQFLSDISSIRHEKATPPEDKVRIISLSLVTVEIQVW